MARYIDADALKADILKKYKQNWEVPCSYEDRIIQRVVTDLRVLIEQNTPADVVPKSEVEKLLKRRRRKKTVAKVKRCPKCGYGVAVLVILNKVGLRFECDFCGHATSAVETVAEAAKEWNGGVVYDA